MNPNKSPLPSPQEVVHLLAVYRSRWLVPAVLVAIVAAVYALTLRPTWQASQALILRNEAASGDSTLGKFNRTDEMKTVQETILELVKSRAVCVGRVGGDRSACRHRSGRLADRNRYPAASRRGHARAAQGGRVRRHRGLLP